MRRRRASAGDNTGGRVAVDVRVRVYPDTAAEARGVVVEDFGELAGSAGAGASVAGRPARPFVGPPLQRDHLGAGAGRPGMPRLDVA